MRTTLAIDDDVLAAARQIAAQRRSSLGEVISDLAREALQPRAPRRSVRNGVTLLPGRQHAPPVTMRLVNELRDEAP